MIRLMSAVVALWVGISIGQQVLKNFHFVQTSFSEAIGEQP